MSIRKSTISIALAVVTFTAPIAAETLVGRATVIDGDTLELHGERIRLAGIDAPESGQFCLDSLNSPWRCGQQAAWALHRLVAHKTISCEAASKDKYDRYIATCFQGKENLNEVMVFLGMALAYRRFSQEYVVAEETAYEYGLGMWKGKFIAPWDWRNGVRFDD